MSTFEVSRLKRHIDEQRAILKSEDTRLHSRAEWEIERLEVLLAHAEQAEQAHLQREKDREAAAQRREEDARAELEARLISEYRSATPGTTEAEAKAALPELLHRHRLVEQDRRDAALADAKRRIGSLL